MVQLAYGQDIAKAIAGLRLGLVEGEVINSFSNYSILEKSYTVAITAVDLETTLSVTLHNGTQADHSVNVGGGTASLDELAALLANSINEDAALNSYVLAVAGTGELELTYKFAGMDFIAADVANTAPVVSVEKDDGEVIPFGYGMSYNGEDKVALSTAGTKFAGVALLDSRLPKLPDSQGLAQERNSYLLDDTGSAMRYGRVWVPVMVDVVAGDLAYVSTDAPTKGQFKNSATTAITTGGEFLKGAKAGELALLSL